MDLSVIIVNYNVKYFLEQCLRSVIKALEDVEGEIIVVDNHSVDGSQQMLRDKFGESVTLIENKDNPGFSKANNQGIAIASGRYVLLLNPDTIVEENTFKKCIAFMDARPRAGALGVKMLDGKGDFLPESKRALPTPAVSFYKIFGLARIFPKSKVFGKYHLSFLDKGQHHEIEILSGAFMWMRKEVLDKIGGLDENFFMYGEDIDLSYRIIQAGYKNYYLPDTHIIHYKGESTKKGSLNYVRVFYQAMIIFAKKHFGGRKQKVFILFIRLAVYFRALLAILSRLIRKLGFPMIEAVLVYGIIQGIKRYWEHYVKYIEGGAYPVAFDTIAAPLYTLVFIGLLAIAGAYKRPYRVPPIINATFWGFVAIATVTFIFPSINFSRAIVGLSSIFTMIMAISTRGFINWRKKGSFFISETHQKQVILAGSGKGIERLGKLLRREWDYPVDIIGGAVAGESTEGNEAILGNLDQLEEIVRIYRAEEVIFDNQSLSSSQIISLMERLPFPDLTYKITPPGTDYLVGPQAVYQAAADKPTRYRLQLPTSRYQKRVFDTVGSAVLIISWPLLWWLYRKPLAAISKLFTVLIGQRHLVGYIHPGSSQLPPIKKGLLNLLNRGGEAAKKLNTASLDTFYARSYSWELDVEIVLKGWREVGRSED